MARLHLLYGQGVEFLTGSLDGGGKLIGRDGIGAFDGDGLRLVIGLGVRHARNVEQGGLDGGIAMAGT